MKDVTPCKDSGLPAPAGFPAVSTLGVWNQRSGRAEKETKANGFKGLASSDVWERTNQTIPQLTQEVSEQKPDTVSRYIWLAG